MDTMTADQTLIKYIAAERELDETDPEVIARIGVDDAAHDTGLTCQEIRQWMAAALRAAGAGCGGVHGSRSQVGDSSAVTRSR